MTIYSLTVWVNYCPFANYLTKLNLYSNDIYLSPQHTILLPARNTCLSLILPCLNNTVRGKVNTAPLMHRFNTANLSLFLSEHEQTHCNGVSRLPSILYQLKVNVEDASDNIIMVTNFRAEIG